jgi:hypothetical protein
MGKAAPCLPLLEDVAPLVWNLQESPVYFLFAFVEFKVLGYHNLMIRIWAVLELRK